VNSVGEADELGYDRSTEGVRDRCRSPDEKNSGPDKVRTMNRAEVRYLCRFTELHHEGKYGVLCEEILKDAYVVTACTVVQISACVR